MEKGLAEIVLTLEHHDMVDFIMEIIMEFTDFFLNLWADKFGNRKEKKM
ncbi:hypothetical protein [Frisingicoccus sp.]|nr:hypothetical protein [Frisingicoccus sp.]MCI7129016.1 hypothetical protein [Lachnospiraceae bacterium]MDD7177801.1 hypothetical protein [bacterium]MDY4923521.1 hypothetical protein [Frisingicoccus sp.]MDY5517509.1 hypothetical protein [Lachnospiraceae bacterium]